jgi:hypothetical protein
MCSVVPALMARSKAPRWRSDQPMKIDLLRANLGGAAAAIQEPSPLQGDNVPQKDQSASFRPHPADK